MLNNFMRLPLISTTTMYTHCFQEGLTALMMATKAGQASTVQILLQSGHVDVNAKENVSTYFMYLN